MSTAKKYTACLALLVQVFLMHSAAVTAEVIEIRTPDEGLQPRLVTDAAGGVHLLYFKKRLRAPSAREGNLYYREYLPTERRFGLPVQVSSTAYDLQTFAIARASFAIDGEGRAHVMWYLPRAAQFFYSRSNPERSRFETQRSMVTQFIEGVDAAGDVAAVGNQVALLWGAGALSSEESRTVYARFSDDGGVSFGPELQVGNRDIGACACCSLAAEFDTRGQLAVAYRSALEGVGRHMQLLTLHSSAASLAESGLDLRGDYAPLQTLQEWELSSCPLSTNDLLRDASGTIWATVETEARVIRLQLGGAASAVREPASPTRQKNPALAIGAQGEIFTAWGEAISHSKGGTLRAQLESSTGELSAWQLSGEPDERVLPNYSFPAAAALAGGDFLLVW